ncbi:thioredoxin family protein [Bacillus andreraoultii]|uniref:thioredoxin family protein n=1 Tax=Bacillus andreraoultii TaxID=1499685 RepID=UPI00053A33F8|nr:thioredoxin family protein [Bacillus andreraoultii]
MEQWTNDTFYQHLKSGKKGGFYLYTPLCGTCQMASKMLGVIEELLPDLLIGKADMNYIPEIAETFFIESVPCLIIFSDYQIKEKIYAFQSVPFLYEKLKSL